MKIFSLAVLLISLILVSGCTSNEPTNQEEPDEQIQDQTKKEPTNNIEAISGTTVVPDIEEQIVKYSWRTRASNSIRIIFTKGFLGNKWEYKSSVSSTGSWELADLTQEDVQKLMETGFVLDISALASKKIVLHGWHSDGEDIDAETVIEVYTNPETNAPELYRILLPSGEYIRDFKNPLT